MVIVNSPNPDPELFTSFHDLLKGRGLRYADDPTSSKAKQLIPPAVPKTSAFGLSGAVIQAREQLLSKVLPPNIVPLPAEERSLALRALALRQEAIVTMSLALPLCVPRQVIEFNDTNADNDDAYTTTVDMGRIATLTSTHGRQGSSERFLNERLYTKYPGLVQPSDRHFGHRRFAEAFGIMEVRRYIAELGVKEPDAAVERLVALAGDHPIEKLRQGLGKPLPNDKVIEMLTTPGGLKPYPIDRDASGNILDYHGRVLVEVAERL